MKRTSKISFSLFTLTAVVSLYTNCSGFSSSKVGTGNSSMGSIAAGPTPFPVVGDYKDSLPSNFDVNAWLEPYDLPQCGVNGAGSMAPDVVGAFRFICNASHVLYDDPIVFPGRAGASHLHTFFGNTKADANSTYESLRTFGDGSCEGGPLNRSAYWMPTMMNGLGKIVLPDYLTVYYKRRPKTDPVCQQQGKECVNLPRGLRMVFGYNMSKPYDDPSQMHPQWVCDDGLAHNGSLEHNTIGETACPIGARVGIALSTPDCWDGVHLDSPDHRSHLAFGSYGGWGYYKCPDTHPYVIPQFTLKPWFSHNGPADLANWYLSSDRMPGLTPAPNGGTFHSDWFGAWDDKIMQIWHDNAIDKMMNCSDGQLGDGQGMKRPPGFNFDPKPLQNPPALSIGQKAINDAAMAEMMKSGKMNEHDEMNMNEMDDK